MSASPPGMGPTYITKTSTTTKNYSIMMVPVIVLTSRNYSIKRIIIRIIIISNTSLSRVDTKIGRLRVPEVATPQQTNITTMSSLRLHKFKKRVKTQRHYNNPHQLLLCVIVIAACLVNTLKWPLGI